MKRWLGLLLTGCWEQSAYLPEGDATPPPECPVTFESGDHSAVPLYWDRSVDELVDELTGAFTGTFTFEDGTEVPMWLDVEVVAPSSVRVRYLDGYVDDWLAGEWATPCPSWVTTDFRGELGLTDVLESGPFHGQGSFGPHTSFLNYADATGHPLGPPVDDLWQEGAYICASLSPSFGEGVEGSVWYVHLSLCSWDSAFSSVGPYQLQLGHGHVGRG